MNAIISEKQAPSRPTSSSQDRQQRHSSSSATCSDTGTEGSSEMTKLKKVTETHYLILPDAKAAAERSDWAPVEEESLGYGYLHSRNVDPILDNRDDDSEAAQINVDSICGVGRDSDQIGAWRREMSFCISDHSLLPSCGDSVVGRLDYIDENRESQQGPMQRLVSIGQHCCKPYNKIDESNEHSSVDGIVAFRQCYSYRVEPADSNRERYALVDAEEASADEDDIVTSTAKKDEPLPLPVDDHTVPSIREGDASAMNQSQVKETEGTTSFLENWCEDGLCGLSSLMRRKNKSTISSVVSISDMTMPEDGGIFVVRNGATREVELGEHVAAVDDQLGDETRNYPGKLIEEKAKATGDELKHKAGEARMSLNGLAALIKTVASTLSQDAEDSEKIRGDSAEFEARDGEEGIRRTSGASLHADMVRDALEEVEARNENEEDSDAQNVGEDCFITASTRASF